ncbi:hypothetical protein ABW19_dt0200940 [Dactylella cylindrospora]|nr:hypothetical protein ABW19_dt0200940 [Dactylella cylindrospora]
MARPKKDTTIRASAEPTSGQHEQSGDGQPQGETASHVHAEEPKKHSARAPTVPFQMVTRRRVAKTQPTSSSAEQAPLSEEPITVGEDSHQDANVAQPVDGNIKKESEPVGEGPGVSASEVPPSEPGVEETPRRSSRVPKPALKKALKLQKPSMIVTLHLPPEKLRQFVDPAPEAPVHREEEVTPSTQRKKRLKMVVKDKSATPISPLHPPQYVNSPLEQPKVVPPEPVTPVPRQKRQRKTKEAVSYQEEEVPENSELDDERPIKRRRKTKKVVEDKAIDETIEAAPMTPMSTEPIPPKVEVPTPAQKASSTTSLRGKKSKSPRSEQEPAPEPEEREPTPAEEPVQKRRGRPPKSEVLKKRQQKRGPTVKDPVPEQISISEEFRVRLPPGYTMSDFLMLARHAQEKNLKSKKKAMRRCVKKGYRVDRRVSKEWCAQRNQKLVNQNKKIDRHLRRANIALVDQTINAVHSSPEYVSESGPAALFYEAGIREATEHRDKLIQQAETTFELRMDNEGVVLEANKMLIRRQFINSVVAALEKLDAQKRNVTRLIVNYSKDHPEEIDAIIERCEETGEETNKAIIDAVLDAFPEHINAMLGEVKRRRGLGLGGKLLWWNNPHWEAEDIEMGDAEPEDPLMAQFNINVMESDLRDGVANDEARPNRPEPLLELLEVVDKEMSEFIVKMADAEHTEIVRHRTRQAEQILLLLASTAAEQERLPEAAVPSATPPEEPPAIDLTGPTEVSEPREPSVPTESHGSKFPTPVFEEGIEIPVAMSSPSPPPQSIGGDTSTDGRSTRGIVEETAEPGFALSGPAPPPDVLRPSPFPETEVRSRFAGGGESRRWTESRMFPPLDRGVFSPLQTHHHYLPGVSPPPPLSAGSSTASLPPPTGMPSPSRVLPSPIPMTRFPAAYQAVSQHSPSPPTMFNTLAHDPNSMQRFRGPEQPR